MLRKATADDLPALTALVVRRQAPGPYRVVSRQVFAAAHGPGGMYAAPTM